MSDATTLVARLRAVHREITESDGGECGLMAKVREAADRIEALEAERDGLRQRLEFDALRGGPTMWPELVQAVEDVIGFTPTDLFQLAGALAQQKDRIEALEERLEINHAYRVIDGEMVRVEADMSENDGIACRNETIRLQDQEIDRLRARIGALEAKFQWKSIATAPRDGRDLILLLVVSGVQDTRTGRWNLRLGRWSLDYGVTRYIVRESMPEPTYWLPLPPPPGGGT